MHYGGALPGLRSLSLNLHESRVRALSDAACARAEPGTWTPRQNRRADEPHAVVCRKHIGRSGIGVHEMDVSIIDQMFALEAIQLLWQRIWLNDTCASIFLNWHWLRGWLDVCPQPWSVLVVRPDHDSTPVAFLPLARRYLPWYRIDQLTELRMVGEPAADYTGFVCAREYETQAIPALANFITRSMRWNTLVLNDVGDERLVLFLQSLRPRYVSISPQPVTKCMRLPLPPTWEEYLQRLSYDTRKSLRKKLRLAEKECRVTHHENGDLNGPIDIVIALAAMRQHNTPDVNQPHYRTMFRAAAIGGIVSVSILWLGETPIAGLASFVDERTRTVCFYLTGFDDRFGKYSPGRVINALCIQRAIERNMIMVDFLRGEEAYKFQLEAQPHATRNVRIMRRGAITAVRRSVNRLRNRMPI